MGWMHVGCQLPVNYETLRTRPEFGLSPLQRCQSDSECLSTMLQWARTLPSSRRLPLSSLPPIRLPQYRHVSFSPLLRPSPYSRLSFRRPIIWLFPLVGGVTIYFYPRTHPLLSPPISSSALKTCPSDDGESLTLSESLILSPSELHLSLTERIYTLFLDHIWEPILTARRFIHLFFLFAPVIISSPMLLMGSPEERLQGDRWGAVWWYDYLVAQMDRAGPTFIKVCSFISYLSFAFDSHVIHWQLAQWAASRADLFPALLCERMGKMHSQGRRHSLAHTKRVIERVFQRPFDDVFEQFDETPIGSGAIAQVCCTFSYALSDRTLLS
jgi:aarF domain-containing kinase